MTNIDYTDISYLKAGNEIQRKSYEILKKIKIFEILKEYKPILVGTIPIEINIESSDLDIVCQVNNFYTFEKLLLKEFSDYKKFKITYIKEDILVCNFYFENIEIEIYASTKDTKSSNGYRHMVVEGRLLYLGGEKFKQNIINLKQSGLKTEPAFAKLLNINGNPYDELLKLETFINDELKVNYNL
ncbi:MAG: DUF4269 domain-containing protein [Peptostreptococcaceae bacterium]